MPAAYETTGLAKTKSKDVSDLSGSIDAWLRQDAGFEGFVEESSRLRHSLCEYGVKGGVLRRTFNLLTMVGSVPRASLTTTSTHFEFGSQDNSVHRTNFDPLSLKQIW
jgi:hypothetical protein